MTRTIIVIAIAGLLAACGGGSGGGGGGGATVPSYSAGSDLWRVFTTKTNGLALADLPDGGVSYDLPTDKTKPAGYVVRSAKGEPRNGILLHMTVSGDGRAEPLNYEADCTGQLAYARLYFQRSGDDWLAKDGTEHYRWWYSIQIPLSPGTDQTLSVSFDLTPALWTSIYGANAAVETAAFVDAVKNMRWIGITHGGCGAAGHGAYAAEGNVRVTIERLEMY